MRGERPGYDTRVFLPIGDSPNPRGFRPWTTWALIAANVLVYLLLTLPRAWTRADVADPAFADLVRRITEQAPPGVDPSRIVASLSAWDLFVEQHGFRPGDPNAADLFASLFLHSGLLHLAGNMLFLGIYGDNVEHRLGRVPFLLTYLASGVAATLAFASIAADPFTPLVGASGAISGALGCYAVLFPRNKVKVLVALFPFLVDVWFVPAPIVLGLYVLVDNLMPLLAGGGGGVAYGAHLGGFLAGLLVALVVRQVTGSRVVATEDGPDALARAHLAQAERMLDQHPVVAYQHLLKALELSRDEEIVTRARRSLDRLPLDPRLRRRLGLD